ncbi:putative GEM-like protein 8 [Elaeis guineensis]|uniref:GEM-like protein 8 n=1 Tax=Elaeis guineensis var. tenera TaxID=51953 RepID=A0A6I9S065_ELAGV|nr:putative GEM-like protein 8 [Elaeis guineensis]
MEASSNVKNPSHDQVIGIPITCVRYVAECPGKPASASQPGSLCLQSTSYGSSHFRQKRVDSVIDWMSRFSKRADNYAKGIRDHVSLGPNISETVKGKLSLGARILQAGGVKKVFRQNFSIEKGEKLLKAFQCYLSTTAGPIAGLLFISTKKIAFHSDRSLTLTSPRGELARVPYKVLIPLERIKRVSQSENANKPNQKYIQLVTKDEFEFWFMGFVSYQRSVKYLRQAISDSEARFLQ